MPARVSALLAGLGRPAWVATLLASALLAATAAHWIVILAAPAPQPGPAAPAAPAAVAPDAGSAALLFGKTDATGAPTPAPASLNGQVLGVIAAGRLGSALIALDGKPARAYAVGASLGQGRQVKAITSQSVVIDDNGLERVLPAPPRTPASVLSPAQAAPGASKGL